MSKVHTRKKEGPLLKATGGLDKFKGDELVSFHSRDLNKFVRRRYPSTPNYCYF